MKIYRNFCPIDRKKKANTVPLSIKNYKTLNPLCCYLCPIYAYLQEPQISVQEVFPNLYFFSYNNFADHFLIA